MKTHGVRSSTSWLKSLHNGLLPSRSQWILCTALAEKKMENTGKSSSSLQREFTEMASGRWPKTTKSARSWASTSKKTSVSRTEMPVPLSGRRWNVRELSAKMLTTEGMLATSMEWGWPQTDPRQRLINWNKVNIPLLLFSTRIF